MVGARRTSPQLGKTDAVTDHRLDYEAHISALSRNCAFILDTIGDALPEPVPSCPDWCLADLIEHLGQVFTFWRVQLEAANSAARTEPEETAAPPSSDLRDWFEDAGTKLDQALVGRDGGEPCWNWSGAELTAGWVARRMALETAVHRFDAELCVGEPSPIDRELAVDGIDEWLAVHLATDEPGASLGGVLCLACNDDPAAWTVEVAGGRLRWREGRGPADAVLVGSASDLYLFSWNRQALGVLDLTGSPDVAAAWGSLTH